MKRILLSLMFLVAVFSVKADQLAYLTKEQADKAVNYLLKLEFVIEYCGCCEDDYQKFIYFNDVYSKHTGYENYYEVYLTIENYDGTIRSQTIDLAYIHVQTDDGLAHCLGLVLGFECDPCTEPFEIYEEGYYDDYIIITGEEARKIGEIINANKTIYLYCGCCEVKNPYIELTVDSFEIFYEDPENEQSDYAGIAIGCIDAKGEFYFLSTSDISVIFIYESKNYAYSLSRKLGSVEFDSCVDGITLK